MSRYSVYFFLAAILAACGGTPPSIPPVINAHPFPLNDTGTTFCRSAEGAIDCEQAVEQDGNTGRDALAQRGALSKQGGGVAGFDLLKLDSQGIPLAVQDQEWLDDGSVEAGTLWHCVQDVHTGMIWEIKSAQSEALNYREALYQWHDTDSARNGGFAGAPSTEVCGSIPCDTQAFVQAMNDVAWCGIDQWRLPSVSEFLSLVVTDHFQLAADSHYFPHMQANHYWTGQSFAPDRSMAWYMYFSDGSPANTLKDKFMYLRLVYLPRAED